MRSRKRRAKKEAAAKAAEGVDAQVEQPKQVPHSIDAMREPAPDVVAGDDPEVAADEGDDEFAAYYAGAAAPRILITTCARASKETIECANELAALMPTTSEYLPRHRPIPFPAILAGAKARGFTDVIALGEASGRLHSLLLCHLPNGPTALFRASGFVPARLIPDVGVRTRHAPELFLRNFTTRVGRRVARMLHAMFPRGANFLGRGVVTMHNQRDFIFLRSHRYIFTDHPDAPKPGGDAPRSVKRVRIQELGPRLTLRLRWLKGSAYTLRSGTEEWALRAKDGASSRKKFFL